MRIYDPFLAFNILSILLLAFVIISISLHTNDMMQILGILPNLTKIHGALILVN